MGGATLISREGRRYRARVCAALAPVGTATLSCRLSVRITFCPPDRRRRDLDNALKCLLDSLQHAGVYADDSLIDHLVIERGPLTVGGGVRVVIAEWTGN